MNKRETTIKAALAAAGLAAVSTASANNIQVRNVTLQNINTSAGTAMVQFDVSWENSWKVTTGPANYDAAWVFVKYHVGDNRWRTASLDASDASHVVPASATLDTGLNGTRGMGAFIHRANAGSGANNFTGVQLKWNFGADGVSNSALVTLDVHAIEMVYVPQGAFSVGDGVSRNSTAPANLETGTLCDGSSVTNCPPFVINTAGPINVGPTAGSLAVAGLAAGAYRAIPNTFPTGFSAFYAMKYEASQGQWAAFLNTTALLTAQPYTYFESTTSVIQAGVDLLEPIRGRQVFNSPDNRDQSPIPYILPFAATSDRPPVPTRPLVTALTPDRAFYTTDVTTLATPPVPSENLTLAYLDWAGLRPMTEFEYEKLCRGPVAPLAGEYAWGTADVALLPYGNPQTFTQGLADDGLASERPALNYNEAGGNAWTRTTTLRYTAGGLVLGPCRVGMFAKSSYNGPTPPRIQAGSGYYGVMDLTGNTSELVVRWNFPAGAGTNFNGEHGDGQLAATGLHDVAGWPAGSYGLRGGSFEEVAVPVALRATLAGGILDNPGIRGLRTAP